jgi:hypothetical protein
MNAANRDDQPFARMTKISPAEKPGISFIQASRSIHLHWLAGYIPRITDFRYPHASVRKPLPPPL